jgi:hypothetical protein
MNNNNNIDNKNNNNIVNNLGNSHQNNNNEILNVYLETVPIRNEFQLSLGPSVVEKVVDSRYRYDTNLADLNLGIGYPTQSTAKSASSRIVIGIGRSPSVPGLVSMFR